MHQPSARIMHSVAIATVVVAVLAGAGRRPAAAAGEAPADTLIAFAVEDQFEREHTDAELRGRALVLVWGDRAGREWSDDWTRALERELAGEIGAGRADVRAVAHVKGVPFFIKGKVRGSFAKDSAAWALLDWKGLFDRAYRPARDHANLLLFDPEGRLLVRAAHRELETEIVAVFAGLIRESLAAQDRPGGDAAAD